MVLLRMYRISRIGFRANYSVLGHTELIADAYSVSWVNMSLDIITGSH